MSRSNKKGIVISLAAFLLLIAGLVTAYLLLKPQPMEGSKTIQVEVAVGGETVKTVDIHTDEAFLLPALQQEEGLIEGSESAAGFWVTAINGIAPDDGNQEWWALYINGEFSTNGVDSAPIKDGDRVEYRLTVGYDTFG